MTEESSKPMANGLSRRELFRTLIGGAAIATLEPSPAKASTRLDQGMHVVITGSGSALADPERGNASAAVVVDGTVVQFDCGRRTMDNLMRAGINPMDVDYLFFTHLHFDHIATYDYFVVSSWISGRRTPFKVYGPQGTTKMSNGAIYNMHEMDVRYVKALVSNWPEASIEPPVSEAPVEVLDCEPGVIVETDLFKVTATATPHIAYPDMKSLGYRVDSRHGSVVISGDTAPSPNMVELARGADVLVHECVVPDFGMTEGGKFSASQFHDEATMNQRTGHTSPTALGKLAQEARVKKLIATHLPPYTSVPAAVAMSEKYYGRTGPEIWAKFTRAMKTHYSGPVILAEDAMVIEI